VILNGAPIVLKSPIASEGQSVHGEPQTLSCAMELLDDTLKPGDPLAAVATMKNLDSVAHTYNMSLFGINADVSTTFPSEIVLGPGESRQVILEGAAGVAGDAAIAVYIWTETDRPNNNWGGAVIASIVPEPSGVILVTIAWGRIARRRRASAPPLIRRELRT